jgi:hypothetical protein
MPPTAGSGMRNHERVSLLIQVKRAAFGLPPARRMGAPLGGSGSHV